MDLAARHDEAGRLQMRRVVERIAGEGDDVGGIILFEPADMIVDEQRPGGADGGRAQRLHRALAGLDHPRHLVPGAVERGFVDARVVAAHHRHAEPHQLAEIVDHLVELAQRVVLHVAALGQRAQPVQRGHRGRQIRHHGDAAVAHHQRHLLVVVAVDEAVGQAFEKGAMLEAVEAGQCGAAHALG
jgi:hypothetical protein